MALPTGNFDLPYDIPANYYPPHPYPKPGSPPPHDPQRPDIVDSEPYEYLPARASIGIKVKSYSKKIVEEKDLYEVTNSIYSYFTNLVSDGHFEVSSIDLVAYGFKEFVITKNEILINFYVEYNPKDVKNLYSRSFGSMRQIMDYKLSDHLEDLITKGDNKFRDLLKSIPVSYNEFNSRVVTMWDEAGRVVPYGMQNNKEAVNQFEINSLFHRWNEMRALAEENFPLEIPYLRNNIPSYQEHIEEIEEIDPEIEDLLVEDEEEIEIQLPFDRDPGSIDAYLNPLHLNEIIEIAKMIGMDRIVKNKFTLIDDIIDYLMD